MKHLAFVFLLVLLAATALNSQNADVRKERLAKSYEQGGDPENAARLYLELFNANKKKASYFRGLVRNYKSMHRYSDLFEIVEEYITTSRSGELLILFGELQWRKGEYRKAKNTWGIALDEFPSRSNFILLAQTQSNLQLFQEAINTLESGREILNIPADFADELSKLYIATGDYENGVDEIIILLGKNRNIALAQGRIYALMTSRKAINYISKSLMKIAGEQENNLNIQQLLAWFLRTTGRQDQAFEVYLRLDKLKNGRGREVLNFANLSRNDGFFDIALKAYEFIIDQGKSNRYTPSALYGYARTLEQIIRDNSTISRQQILQIIDRYEKIISEYPKSNTATEAMFRIADLHWEFLDDPDMAVELYLKLIKKFPGHRLSAKASVSLAGIYLNNEDFKSATKTLKHLLGNFQRSAPEEVEEGKFLLAEIQYFSGGIDSAVALYRILIKNKSSDVANDALKRLAVIEQNKNFISPLGEFARSEYLLFKRDYSGAFKQFEDVSKQTEGSDLYERCMMKMSEIKFTIGDYSAAIKILREMIEKNPDTIYGDSAFMTIGKAFLMENNKIEAEKSFTQILMKYPKSIHIQEAREKIRAIRNDDI